MKIIIKYIKCNMLHLDIYQYLLRINIKNINFIKHLKK